MTVLSLLLLAAVIFILGNLLLLPLWLAATSLTGALSAPAQFLKIAGNQRLRQNHALEHATLNVLEERFGRQRLSGMSREDGFILRGYGDPALIQWAAEEGLARLKRGEGGLALHDRCGTSIASANLVSSVVLLVLLFGLGRFSLLNVVGAMVLANLGGPVLGRLFQRFLTTTAVVDDVFIVGFDCGPAGSVWNPFFVNPAFGGVPLVCHVRTVALPAGRDRP